MVRALVISGCILGALSFGFLTNTSLASAEKQILFRVPVSNIGLQNSSLVRGLQPTDVVEVILPGHLYDPPKRFKAIDRSLANWKTPIDAAVADFSAFKADDDRWILEDFVPEEQGAVRSLLDDKAAHDQNRKIFAGRRERYITGEVTYRGYTIILTRDTGESHAVPLTFKRISSGWKRTNALSRDETFDIVFSALYNGGEVMVLR